jgi:CDP-diglyceride synthetase
MEFLRTFHGHNKWLVLLALVVALLVQARALHGAREYGKLERATFAAGAGLLGLQVVLGLILLTQYGLSLPHVIEHATTMLLAFVVAHVPFRFKQRASAERARAGVLCLSAAVVLIVVGIARLPYPFFGGSKKAAAAQVEAPGQVEAPASAPSTTP